MPNRTPIYGLPMPTPGEYVNLDVINEVTQKTESGISDPARHVNPCTEACDAPAKRHILTLAHRGPTLPGLFSARFQAAAGFSTGDKVCLDGVEYVPAYTGSSAAVATGAWASGAAVTLTLDKSTGKAYVGRAIPETAADVGAAAASHGHPIGQVANLSAQLANKVNKSDLPMESGTWTPTIYGEITAGTPAYTETRGGAYVRLGKLVFIRCSFGITSKGGMAGNLAISGLPFVATSGATASCSDVNGINLASGTLPGFYVTNHTITLRTAGNGAFGRMSADRINDAFSLWGLSATYMI